MEIVAPSWKQHLLQRERMTKNEKEVLLKLSSLRSDPNRRFWSINARNAGYVG
jgi:hypothetical protein